LEDILQSAIKIQRYTANKTLDTFLEDEILIDAIFRNFEIIGEAANRLEETFKLSNNDINWIRISGLRNRIIHEYFGIDLSTIWKIKESYLPSLIVQITQLIQEL